MNSFTPGSDRHADVAASSYMLFDTESGNAIGSYSDVIEARVALRQAVECNPEDTETLVLIGYDEAGMPVGEAVTFADLPPSSFTIEVTPFVQTTRTANGR